MLDNYCPVCGNESLIKKYDGTFECSECGWLINDLDSTVSDNLDDLDEF